MTDFQIYPAIDLHEGRVVRLKQGDLSRQTTYFDRPAEAAQQWIDQGAQWLHVVNLDGAFGNDQQANIDSLKDILRMANGCASVQFGGGLRDLSSLAWVLDMGVNRVVIGTAAVKNPRLMHGALRTFGPQRVILGVDARDGFVRVSGWLESAEQTPMDLIRQFLPDGLQTVIYTNIQRDGMGSGPDVAGAQRLHEATGVSVIASGGVASTSHIQAVRQAGLAGVVVGQALYQGQFTVTEAQSC
jgi:phosphoribosylformimino-5-aminoimidazole carboxamide ribotide isomerase